MTGGFLNEIEAIHEYGGKVIRLTRCLYSRDTHDSEIALDPEFYNWNNFDYILDNTNINLNQQRIVLQTVATAWEII